MDGVQGVPYWLAAVIALVSAIIAGVVVHFFTRLWEHAGKILCCVDNWQFSMNKPRRFESWDHAETLADATWVEFRFTPKLFNTKKIAVGLHRARIEFTERRWLRRRKILATTNIRWIGYGGGNGMPPTTYAELTLPSREWVTPGTEGRFGDPGLCSEEDAKVRPLDLARCNAVYITAETAEGSKKRWLIRKSL